VIKKITDDEYKISFPVSRYTNSATLHISEVLNSVLKCVSKEEIIGQPECFILELGWYEVEYCHLS
jgi:hypothetical protein